MSFLTTLTLIGIQRFVFASNRMRDVVGASSLVRRASSADGALAELKIDPDDIIVAAGGRITLRFDDLAKARIFAQRYTVWLATNVPGIDVALIHREYESHLSQALHQAFIDLDRAIENRIPPAPLLGVSVTEVCRETGLPAASVDDRGPIAESVAAARQERPRARERWRWAIPPSPTGIDLAFPADIDDLGRTDGSTSLVGVVHVDGNRVGEKLRAFFHRCTAEGTADDAFLAGLRGTSRSLEDLGETALCSVRDRVAAAFRVSDRGRVAISGRNPDLAFELAESGDGRTFLPFIPILLGGDDLTFVADGRIALDLAAAALEAYRSMKDVGAIGAIGACAGVAIGGSHAPFYRAYGLAEALCDSAKRSVAAHDPAYAMDWHIGESRAFEPIEAMRGRRYAANSLSLTARPYPLGSADQPLTWRWLNERVLSGLMAPPWDVRRRKIRSLPPVLRDGPAAVRRTVEAWRVVDRALSFPGGIPDEGFVGVATPLLDANELLDIHLGLDATPATQETTG
jgi:hypothetical protein